MLIWNTFYIFLTLFLDHTRSQTSEETSVILEHLLVAMA